MKSNHLELTEQYLESKKDFWAAARYGVRAILTSPRFIYLVENAPHPAGQWLDGYELASRLSYFLWSSMPDEELRAAAASGRLGTPDGLRAEVERMLRDSRASAFNRNFAEQWLHLRKLGEMPPDPEKNRAYYQDDIETAMRDETRLYFSMFSIITTAFFNSLIQTTPFSTARWLGTTESRGLPYRVSTRPT